jgi:hypothetical protein
MLPWVDWLFGTYYTPRKQWPVKYGIDTSLASGWVAQLIEPLGPTPSSASVAQSTQSAAD